MISNFKVKNCFNCAFGKYDGFCIRRNDKLGYYTDCKFYSGSYIPTAVFHILGSRKHHEILEDIREFRRDVLDKNESYRKIMFRYDTIGPMIAYNIEKDYRKTHDKSLAISLLEHYIKPIIALYKEGKEESAIVKFGQMEDVLEECYNFNNSFSNVQEIEKIKKKALIDNIWNKY